jgi:ABC-type polar amino acid transport system ATPase subunit
MFLTHAQTPIKYEYVTDKSLVKNVFMIGNIGNGKSAILNKMAQVIEDMDQPNFKIDDVTLVNKPFPSKRSCQVVTKENSSKIFKNFCLFDT